MKVIFLKDVPRVGRRHDIKEVNDGYAMNFLLPRKLVELATPKTVAGLELRKKTIEIEREVLYINKYCEGEITKSKNQERNIRRDSKENIVYSILWV